MNRSEILDTAKQYITKDRAATHGDAGDSFAAVCLMWDALDLARGNRKRSAEDVALYLDALKSVRAATNPTHADNWVDKAGYNALGGEIATGGGA